MTADDDSPEDLAALLSRVKQRLFAAERPVLDAHGLNMWEYIALIKLSHGAAPTQLALSEQMGYDKNRLIALLDRLADEGLVVREPDPDDRRARIVGLTDAGRRHLRRTRTALRVIEDELLAEVGIAAEDAAALRRMLTGLAAGLPAAEPAPPA